MGPVKAMVMGGKFNFSVSKTCAYTQPGYRIAVGIVIFLLLSKPDQKAGYWQAASHLGGFINLNFSKYLQSNLAFLSQFLLVIARYYRNKKLLTRSLFGIESASSKYHPVKSNLAT